MHIKTYFTKKRVIWGIVGIVVIAIIIVVVKSGGSAADKILSEKVQKRDLIQSVLATGQVTSVVDLSLSFKSSGVVTQIRTATGNQAKTGDILATLDQKNEVATLTQARGSYAAAQANYDKVLAGASSEEVEVARTAVAFAQATLDNARATYNVTVQQQKVAVANAYAALLNNDLTADPKYLADKTVVPVVSGTYDSTIEGEYQINLQPTGTGFYYYIITGLESDSQIILRGLSQPLGKRGLSITFPTSGTLTFGDTWIVRIPNRQSTSYTTYYNAYQTALQTQAQSTVTAQNTINSAQGAFDQAKASLALKQAAARPQEIASAQAQLLSAQGQLLSAQASYENTIIRAPANGTVTNVVIKVGELATALKEAIVLQDVGNLHIEANISEANIASLQIGQKIDVTFDAFGPDRKFTGTVQAIDPASTVVSGVVNYKVTSLVDKSDEIKPGMTANMTIFTANKTGVLSVSQRAIISKDSVKFVRVITDPKSKTYREQEVAIGLSADEGLVEITSGLEDGQEVVSYINK